jgi:hypothetical protein
MIQKNYFIESSHVNRADSFMINFIWDNRGEKDGSGGWI